ncbi:sterol desaturase family protein [Polynucleobacter rarus]|uniref:sterol desaturase family protein n=1 Tax=Polynucleobacter rarus TaxID=556055 RepID=UPI000D3E1846|nr:sterol desaturase family protein [Polynucleobacter rarus]
MNLYDDLHEWLMQNLILPIFFQLDWMSYVEDSTLAVDWFLLGVFQITIIAFILRPAEAKEEGLSKSGYSGKAAISSDIFYCFIHRLGLIQLLFFFTLNPLFIKIGSSLHDVRFERLNLENILPSINATPLLSFIIYLIILDFVDYLYHRVSHRFSWWWQLHALHHSQRHMTVWTDNRNHLIDDVLKAFVFSTVALVIGIEPSQFILLVALSHLIQSWQHGYYVYQFHFLKYLIVTPSFHRYHHAMRLGYELPGKPGVLGGCNFGVLFPWWDLLFQTAIFDNSYHPTGVDSIVPSNNPFIQQIQFLRNSIESLKRAFSRQDAL